MPSEYPILDNRPIDQWKVTELKEELRRRKLTTKGLKEDLVKRLDEAIRYERELVKENELNSSDTEFEPQDKDDVKDSNPTEISPIEEDTKEPVADDERKISENEMATPDTDDNLTGAGQATEMATLDTDDNLTDAGQVTEMATLDTDDNLADAGQAAEMATLDTDDNLTDAGQATGMATLDTDDNLVDAVQASEVATLDTDDNLVDAVQASEVATLDTDDNLADAVQATEVVSLDTDDNLTDAVQATEVVSLDTDDNLTDAVQATDVAMLDTDDNLPDSVQATEVATLNNDDNIPSTGQTTEVQDEPTGTVDLDGAVEGTVAPGAATEDDVSHVELAPGATTKDNVSYVELTLGKSEANGEDCTDDMDSRDSKLPTEDTTTSNLLEPENQVSEVSPDLGFQVKCESISTDSVSINEKIELKDNLNANNFHLELEVVKSEMVQPSSSDVVPVAGDFNPLDNDQEPEDNRGSVEEIEDVANTSSVELTKEIVNSNGGSPEKLNLDRSSGDESMEEDVLDTKHIESNNNPDVVGDTREVRELHVVKEGAPLDAVMGGFPADKDIVTEENIASVLAEKRKLEDQGSLGITEPVKRQRRWNAETIKVPEPQTSNQTSMTPKDIFLSTPRRIFTRTDSGLSGDSPKERFVPPSPKAATTSLRIDRFLRPFTLKAVQELLAKTGTVCSFWMDHIKTHCYVTYSSVEEAIATRNVLYNLQWPPNGGRLLTADFVDPQEVKMHVEAPESPAPVGPSTVAPSAPSIERPNASQPPLQSNRQQLPPPPLLPQPPPVLQPPPARECERLAPPPPPKKPEPPILTLDDLFKKTRATPRIYYLPLSEEQVAARLGAQGRSSRV